MALEAGPPAGKLGAPGEENGETGKLVAEGSGTGPRSERWHTLSFLQGINMVTPVVAGGSIPLVWPPETNIEISSGVCH